MSCGTKARQSTEVISLDTTHILSNMHQECELSLPAKLCDQTLCFGISEKDSAHRAIAAPGTVASPGPVAGRGVFAPSLLMLNVRYRLPSLPSTSQFAFNS
jgi:hypothetical protein